MRLVLIESPYSGDVETHTRYARRAMLDAINRGECPIVGHLLYTQVLDDTDPKQRALGITLHLSLHQAKIKTVVYTDYNISLGMNEGIKAADENDTKIEYRTIGKNPDDQT